MQLADLSLSRTALDLATRHSISRSPIVVPLFFAGPISRRRVKPEASSYQYGSRIWQGRRLVRGGRSLRSLEHYIVTTCFSTCYNMLTTCCFLLCTIFEKIRQSQTKFEKIREGWRRLEKVGEGRGSQIKFEKARESQRKFMKNIQNLENVRERSRKLEKANDNQCDSHYYTSSGSTGTTALPYKRPFQALQGLDSLTWKELPGITRELQRDYQELPGITRNYEYPVVTITGTVSPTFPQGFGAHVTTPKGFCSDVCRAL